MGVLTILSAMSALILSGFSAPSSGDPAVRRSTLAGSATAYEAGQPHGAGESEYAGMVTSRESGWRNYEANLQRCDKAGEATESIRRTTRCPWNGPGSSKRSPRAAKEAADAFDRLPTPPPAIEPLITRTVKALEPIVESEAQEKCAANSNPRNSSVQQVNDAVPALIPILRDWDARHSNQ